MNNNLGEKIEKIIYDNLDDFEIYDFEATKKHVGEISSLLYSHLIKKLPKRERIKNFDELDYDQSDYVHYMTAIASSNITISEIKQILRRELIGK
jgi:hypothetical protein